VWTDWKERPVDSPRPQYCHHQLLADSQGPAVSIRAKKIIKENICTTSTAFDWKRIPKVKRSSPARSRLSTSSLAKRKLPWQEQSGEVFSETEQMELASEMLEITSEAELDRFLGRLIKGAGQAVGKFVSSPTGQAIGGILKGAAKQVLPTLGSAIGGHFGGEQGVQFGSQIASAASQLFGLELEGLSSEDQEFEVARRYVRFAGEALKNAMLAPTSPDPRVAANAAAVAAARTHAPGLLQAPPDVGLAASTSRLPIGPSGRWIRRGNKIVLYGI
jgi:hypothetical protein